MITSGIQFVHIEVYSLAAAKKTAPGATVKWAVRDILAEANREKQACLHVLVPRPPVRLHGPSLDELEAEVRTIHARSTDAAGRRLRKDASVLLAGVTSYPREGIQYEYWKQSTVAWLKLEFGDGLRSVVEHNDETHPHLHFFVVNPIDGNVKNVHPGFRQARGSQTPKEQRIAYNAGMRQFQDRFWEHVAAPSGLSRLGPRRRRLSRVQWIRERFAMPVQAVILQRAREITQGNGERERQLHARVQKLLDAANAMIQDVEVREARIAEKEAKLGLAAREYDSIDPDNS